MLGPGISMLSSILRLTSASIDRCRSVRARIITSSSFDATTVLPARERSVARCDRSANSNTKQSFAPASPANWKWNDRRAHGSCRRDSVGRTCSKKPAEFDRPVIERVLSRPVRDAAFAHAVRGAYGATCAMTGLEDHQRRRPCGSAGRAHPTRQRPRSGLYPQRAWRCPARSTGCLIAAWSRSARRRAIPSCSRARACPTTLCACFTPELRLALPNDHWTWPAPSYLDYHRSQIFKG